MNMRQDAGMDFAEGLPKICVPLTETTGEALLAVAKRATESSADLVEIRADYLMQSLPVSRLFTVLTEVQEVLHGKEILFTYRTAKEGGAAEALDGSYVLYCMEAIASGQIDYLDVEFSSPYFAFLRDAAHKAKVPVIASSHFFSETPPLSRMVDIFLTMEREGADIAKLAVMPKTRADVISLMNASRRAGRTMTIPKIAISMGEMGQVTRILAEVTGSFLTFGTLEKASAPGQMDAELLRQRLMQAHMLPNPGEGFEFSVENTEGLV